MPIIGDSADESWESESFIRHRVFGFLDPDRDSAEKRIFGTKPLKPSASNAANPQGDGSDSAKRSPEWHIAVSFDASLVTLCAHEMFSRFLEAALSDGSFTRMQGNTTIQENNVSDLWKNFGYKTARLLTLQIK
jgi:hypothetical protein